MVGKFSTGDHVAWKSHGSTTEGTVRASDDDPRHEVRSATSGRTAVHEPGALEHETGDRR